MLETNLRPARRRTVRALDLATRAGLAIGLLLLAWMAARTFHAVAIGLLP